jgi:hypothetical protein
LESAENIICAPQTHRDISTPKPRLRKLLPKPTTQVPEQLYYKIMAQSLEQQLRIRDKQLMLAKKKIDCLKKELDCATKELENEWTKDGGMN